MKKTLLPTQALRYLREQAETLPGNATVVCVGVYGGGDILAMAQNRKDLRFIAIDSFEGLAEPTILDNPQAEKGMFAYSLPDFVANVGHLCGHTHKMWITPEMLDTSCIRERIDMLWIDLDHAAPTKAILDYFLPQCHDGTIVFTHDYENPNYPGIKAVCDEYGEWELDKCGIARLIR